VAHHEPIKRGGTEPAQTHTITRNDRRARPLERITTKPPQRTTPPDPPHRDSVHAYPMKPPPSAAQPEHLRIMSCTLTLPQTSEHRIRLRHPAPVTSAPPAPRIPIAYAPPPSPPRTTWLFVPRHPRLRGPFDAPGLSAPPPGRDPPTREIPAPSAQPGSAQASVNAAVLGPRSASRHPTPPPHAATTPPRRRSRLRPPATPPTTPASSFFPIPALLAASATLKHNPPLTRHLTRGWPHDAPNLAPRPSSHLPHPPDHPPQSTFHAATN